MKPRVCIVGAGIAGLSTAWYLAKQGYSITIFDKGIPGKGTTSAAAGMLAPINELELTELDLLQAGIQSQQLFQEWKTSLGDIGWIPEGTLEVAQSRDDLPGLERLFEYQIKAGLEVYWHTAPELQSLEPLISTEVPAGIFAPSDVQVDNRKLALRLHEQLLEMGVTFQFPVEIVHQEMGSSSISILDNNGNKWEGEILVWCTGSSPLPLTPSPLKILPVKGEIITVQPESFFPLQKTIRIRSRRYGNGYVVPKSDRIVCGATAEFKGFQSHNTFGRIMDILRRAHSVLPGLAELNISEMYTGFRPAAAHFKPVIDKLPDSPVYVVNGLYRHGILLAPLIGSAAATLIHSGERLPWIESFRFP